MTLPNYDAWLEPDENPHEDGCQIDHDPEDNACYTRDDFLADEADAARDRGRDDPDLFDERGRLWGDD